MELGIPIFKRSKNLIMHLITKYVFLVSFPRHLNGKGTCSVQYWWGPLCPHISIGTYLVEDFKTDIHHGKNKIPEG